MDKTTIRGSLFLGFVMVATLAVGFELLSRETETVWQNPRCEVLADPARPGAPTHAAHCIVGPLPLRESVRVR